MKTASLLARGAHVSAPTYRLVTALLLAVLSSGCGRVAEVSAPPVTLRVAGSSSMAPMLHDLASAYEQAHPSATVLVNGGGSLIGLDALAAGQADIAAVSWAGDSTSDSDTVRGVPIARDGLAVIVHPLNPISDLTLLQLRALYRGEVLDWQSIGGAVAEPVLISREEGSGDRGAFEGLVMGSERVTLGALVLPTAQAVEEYVAEHPAAIGYVSMAQHNDRVRVLAIEGLQPSTETVRSGAYHLTRLLYLFVPESAPPQVKSFLDFVLGPSGQSIVAAHHVSLR